MEAVFESSSKTSEEYFTLRKYKNLFNLPHYHDDYELIHIDEGVAEITINNVLYVLHGGDSAFLNPNDIHRIKSDEHTIISVIKADNSYFKELFSEQRLVSPVLKGDYFTSDTFAAIRNEINKHDRYGKIISLSMLSIAFAKMMEGESTCEVKKEIDNSRLYKKYDRICELISRDYATLTFSDAAEHMGFTKPYFSKLFYKMFGMTFTEYLNTVRIGMAIKKLKDDRANITEIAYSCGFNTIRSFNRTFKELTGYTPSSLPQDYVYLYRIRQKEGINPTLNCTVILES